MKDIVVDACCLINLMAAGGILPMHSLVKEKDELVSFPANLHVPVTVQREALYILQPDADNHNSLMRTEIDLSASIDRGLLSKCDLESENESRLFVQLAIRLDDGEAASLSIAKTRSWSLATDDRVAEKLAADLGVRVWNTAQMVKMWASHAALDAKGIEITIKNIRTFANFAPRKHSPEYAWWNRHANY